MIVDDVQRSLDDLVAVGCRLVGWCLTGEVQKPTDDPAATLGFSYDCLQIVPGVGILGPIEQEAAVGQDSGQRIVDLMGDAGRQPPDGCQLARLIDLCLCLCQLTRHLVERGGEASHFVVSEHLCSVAQISFGDARRGT